MQPQAGLSHPNGRQEARLAPSPASFRRPLNWPASCPGRLAGPMARAWIRSPHTPPERTLGMMLRKSDGRSRARLDARNDGDRGLALARVATGHRCPARSSALPACAHDRLRSARKP